MPITDEITAHEAYAKIIEKYADNNKSADDFIEILNLSYSKIDIRNGVATAVNGVDENQKTSLTIDKKVLVFVLMKMKKKLKNDFEKEVKNYIESQKVEPPVE